MTIEEAAQRVNEIKAVATDSEHAHILEDKLYRDVLESIVRGEGDPVTLAAMALTTKAFDFKRWMS